MKKNLLIASLLTLGLLTGCSKNLCTGIIGNVKAERGILHKVDKEFTVKLEVTFTLEIDNEYYVGKELEVVTYDKDENELYRGDIIFDDSMKTSITYYEIETVEKYYEIENLEEAFLILHGAKRIKPYTRSIVIYEGEDVRGTAQINEFLNLKNPFEK